MSNLPILDFARAQWRNLPITADSFANQTIIVTGANTGLGLEAARHYVSLNASRVILAVRSLSKGEAAKASIEASTGRVGAAEVWHLDLSSFDSVKAFAQRAERELGRIDAVVENAAVALDRWTVADEGHEMSVAVNVLGTMLLAVLLLPVMRAKAQGSGSLPCLTVVTSGLHADAKFQEGEEEEIFAALDRRNEVAMSDRYSVSKLLEVYAVRALAGRLPVSQSGVVINMLNPGLCRTELTRELGFTLKIFIGLLRLVFARTAEMGSRTLLHASVAGEESHGKYCSDCEIKEHWIGPNVTSEQGQIMQEKVWTQLTTQLEKIEPGCVARALQRG